MCNKKYIVQQCSSTYYECYKGQTIGQVTIYYNHSLNWFFCYQYHYLYCWRNNCNNKKLKYLTYVKPQLCPEDGVYEISVRKCVPPSQSPSCKSKGYKVLSNLHKQLKHCYCVKILHRCIVYIVPRWINSDTINNKLHWSLQWRWRLHESS